MLGAYVEYFRTLTGAEQTLHADRLQEQEMVKTLPLTALTLMKCSKCSMNYSQERCH